MQWEKEHPDIIQVTADFVRYFQDTPDPIVSVAKKADTLEAKIAWVLLGSCLSQEIPLMLLQKVLDALFQKFPGEKLWTFPLPTEAAILETVRSAKKTFDWPVEESVPGIFWSVGNFVRRRTPLVSWASSTAYKGILRDLGEIFFMGKGAYRPKAIWATSRLFSPEPRGLGIPHGVNPGDLIPVPFAFEVRSWIGLVGMGKAIGYGDLDEAHKRKLNLSICKTLSPKDPRIAAHSFQFFEEPMGDGLSFCKRLRELFVQEHYRLGVE
ncbi:MAG: hypothetical protein J6Z31_00675 [Fibrobacter sp.]|nr:hypothetical protein [Fibrobacter sp.]